MFELLGYTKEEFLGKELWEIGLLRDRESNRVAFTELKASKYIRYRDLPLKTKNGERKEVEFVSNVYSEDDRQVIQCNIRDITESNKLIEGLRESEASLAKAQRIAHIGNWDWDLQTNSLVWSDEILRIYGITNEQFKGIYQAFIDQVHPDDLKLVEFAVEEALKEEIAGCNFVHRIVRPDGTVRIVEEIGEVTFDDSGKPLMFSGTVQDLTERKQAEERFKQLVDSTILGIIITNLNGVVIDANDIFLEMVGYSRKELEDGKVRWDEMTPAEFRLEEERLEITTFGSTKPHRKEYIKKDGCRIPVMVGGTLLAGSKDTIVGFVLDISEQIQAEQELLKAEANFRNLVESSPGIVYLLEPDPPYLPVYISPNIEKYGYTAEEWYSKPIWSSILYAEDRENATREFETAVSHGFETDFSYRIVARDGSIHWWQDNGRFVLDEQGNRIGWQGLILDITATKLLEHQLRQSQKLESVGLLAGGIAHDFNNMLTAINGYSELILRKLGKDDPLYFYAEEISKAGQRSATLTNQLLAFSRQQVLNPALVNINDLINDTMKILQRVIGEDIQLKATLNSQIGNTKVDPGQFAQIIMNLAVNARDAMPQGGKLTIETANILLDEEYCRHHLNVSPGIFVMVAVSDTGNGMSEVTKQHIFEPFFTTKDVGLGTGLGLATVHGIVNQSGGNIEVYSEEGVGTTFKVYFPVVSGDCGKPIPTVDLVRNYVGTETILLVEDEELVRNLSREILKSYGYNVITANNGMEALDLFERQNCTFDLLMTDIVMPQIGGRVLAEKLLEKLPNLLVLFTSGYTDDAVVRHGVIDINTNFIQKPFSPEALAIKVREIIENSRKD